MARKPKVEWTVRVVIWHDRLDTLSDVWVEQLRYMGHAKLLAENTDRKVVEFYAPPTLNSEAWATTNASRMRSFGFNAVPAPRWNGHDAVSLDV